MTLAQFPNGCAGCGGACCKEQPNGIPPFVHRISESGDELNEWETIFAKLPAVVQEIINDAKQKSECAVKPCLALTSHGFCGIQSVFGFKPIECVEEPVGGSVCLESRRKAGG